MMDEAIGEGVKSGKDMFDLFYSEEPQSPVPLTRLFLVQPLPIMINQERMGGALLMRSDWLTLSMPMMGDQVSVGPNRVASAIKQRLFHRDRVALLLHAIEVSQGSGSRASFQVQKWIKGGWSLIWADRETCDDIDIGADRLAFQVHQPRTIPAPFLAEIQELQPDGAPINRLGR